MANLFIVATPIGNLGDMTFRAVETLKSVDFVVCEDTRKSKILFDHYEIDTQRLSFHARSSDAKVDEILKRIKKGESCAQISDAGTPGVSDPGFKLISKAAKEGIKIIPIPGASAFLTLISASGYPIDKFFFAGFLPHKKGRQTFIKSMIESEVSTVFYESVHRFEKFLNEAEEFLGNERKICVGRELTKMYEEIFRGTVAEAKEFFGKENTRGEFVVLVAPKGF